MCEEPICTLIAIADLRARYYDPSVGRFMTRDTYGGVPIRPISLNKYLYAEGNPMLYTDPSGHFGIVGLMVNVAIAGALSAIAIGVYVGPVDSVRTLSVGLEVRAKFPRMMEQYVCCRPGGSCSIAAYDGVIDGSSGSWTIAHRISGCRLKAKGIDADDLTMINVVHELYEFFRPLTLTGRAEWTAFETWEDYVS